MSHSNPPTVRNRAPLTARFSSLRCVSAADHKTAEQYSKNCQESISQETLYHETLARTSSRYLETERRYFSKVIFESNVTPKITRSSDTYSTVPPIVNGGDWGCIVRDLETITVLVLLAFNFIPQRSHHSLTLPRSRIRDSATATLTPGVGTTAIKVESSA